MLAEHEMNEIPAPPTGMSSVNQEDSMTAKLAKWWVPFPQGTHHQVVNFWVGMYQGELGIAPFMEGIEARMSWYGYRSRYRLKSFDQGIIGVARWMSLYTNGRAWVALYFQRKGTVNYVSLRLYYVPFLSMLRVLLCGGIALIIGFLMALSGMSVSFLGSLIRNPDRLIDGEFLIQFSFTGLVLSCIVFLVMVLWSGIKSGDPLRFLYADVSELYRDDLAIIGNHAYLSIVQAADELSLQSVMPEGMETPPRFGASLSQGERKRRI